MKRIFLIMVMLFACTSVAYAAGINGDYKGHDIVNITYEGQPITASDVPAILYDDRTMLPLDMLRKVGFDVGWDGATYTADITPAKPEKPEQTVKTLAQIKDLQNCIALIYELDDQGVRRFQGSGFIINSHGLLITANHVLMDDKGNDMALEVILNGKTYHVPKSVVAFRDADLDIAGVYLYDSKPFPYLKIGDVPSDGGHDHGDMVYDVGYPHGKFMVYSGEAEYIFDKDKSTYDSAKIQPGISGGAQFNQYGQVVGVVVGGDELGGSAVWITEVMNLYQKSLNQ